MKRFTLVVLALALLVAIFPAAAQSSVDLTALAQYLPESAPVYVAVRTDDGFFSELEALRARFTSILPAGADEGETIVDMLNEFASEATEQDDAEFATTIRPWLGGVAAAGALNLDSMMGDEEGPFLVAVEITNREAAQAFFDDVIARGEVELDVETTDSYTLYTSARESAPGAMLLADQVLLLTNKPEALPTAGPLANPLANAAQFQATLAELPAGSYHALVYLDYGSFVQASLAQASDIYSSDAQMFNAIGPMLDMVKGMAIGLTQLDGRALTADFALGWDPTAMDGMMADMSAFQAVDPAFAAHLPGGTQFAIQGTNLAESFRQGMANLQAMAELQAEASGDDQAVQQARQAVAGITFALRGIAGLDLEDDLLPWMNGQYALSASFDFLTLMSAAMEPQMPVDAIEFSFVVENTTGEGAQALVAGLTDGLTQMLAASETTDVTLTEDTIGGAPALLIAAEAPNMDRPFEIIIGGNESVFVIGTPASARAALAPDGGLDGDAAYQESQVWSLAGTPALLYFSGDFFNQIVESVMLGMSAASPDAPEIAPLFSSSTVSATYTDTAVTARLVLALAE